MQPEPYERTPTKQDIPKQKDNPKNPPNDKHYDNIKERVKENLKKQIRVDGQKVYPAEEKRHSYKNEERSKDKKR